MIENGKVYVLSSLYEEGFPPRNKTMTGKELKENFEESKLEAALNERCTLLYKGNEYFLDEALN